jgi:serine/threonine protein phosphatase PrpC
MKCPNCEYENRGDASFCQYCGAVLTTPNPGEPKVPLEATRPLPSSSGGQAQDFTAASDTRPLAETAVVVGPLPEGALLRGGRYVILEVRNAETEPYLYLVEDTVPTNLCPNCQSEATDLDERFCSFCGADLDGAEVLHLRYQVQESTNEQAFAAEAQLLGMRLEHPSLIFPREVFTEAPFGSPRHYLVGPEFPPALATTFAVPQKLNRVLTWGVSLAYALGHLHRHHLTLQGAGLEHIALEGTAAYWTNLGVARVIPPDARSQATGYFVQDVRGLASALFYLATGSHQYDPQAMMPEQVAHIFDRALASQQGFGDAGGLGTALEAALQEIRRPASVNLIVGRATDVGQERSLNEDSLLTVSVVPVYRSMSAPVGVFAVADGMGGHEAGDTASHAAISALAQESVAGVLRPASVGEPLPEAGEWLTQATQAANRAVYDRRTEAGTDMGTTLVTALFVGDTATISNVGDSRAYLLNEEKIIQVTTDHSLVERLVATGQITPEEAINHPQKNVIYRVIGDRPRVENDVYEQRLAPGEALLMCSDGLSGMVPDDQIWHIWRTSTSPQEACDRLVEAANEAGGEDNITVVIVQIGQ